MSKVSIKEKEKALFIKSRAPQAQGKGMRRYNGIGDSSKRRQPRWQQGQHGQGPSREGWKKGDITIKKINAINVARKDTLLKTTNLLKYKVMY